MSQLSYSSDIQQAFSKEAIQTWLVSNLAEQLGVSPDEIDIHAPLDSLGLDSVKAMLLVSKTEKMLGFEISAAQLWHYPTIDSLAERLAEEFQETEIEIGQASEEAGVTRRQSLSAAPTKQVDLKAEAVLDPSIYPDPLAPEPPVEPRYILLTGGTGYLGAYLLYELLQETQAEIYCLVRAANVDAGKERLQKNLERYDIWNQEFNTRIIPVLGDVSKPLLGIEPKQFQMLAEKIDTIHHSAASVNYIYPYEMLKAGTVVGTQEILRFACQTRVKALHYVSSIAVFESSNYAGKVVTENDNVDETEGILLGYSQSKWVAEKIVMMARDRGLPVAIYRPSFITGDSQTGISNTSDFLHLMLKSSILMQAFPDLDYRLDASPVDYVSKAIVYLSKQKESRVKAFHLQDPQPIHMQELYELINSLGYKVQGIPYREWQEKLKQVRSPEHPLYALQPLLLERHFEEEITIPELYLQTRRPEISCQETLSALAGSGINCPPQDQKLLATFLPYLNR